MKKQFISLLLVMAMLFCFNASLFDAAVSVKIGDINQNGKIEAADALIALQGAVSKITLSEAQKTLGDVNGDASINSTDALLILQYSVGKISEFPSLSGEEKYYKNLDSTYKINSSDFTKMDAVDNLDDSDAIVNDLGKVAYASDVDTYDCDKYGRLIYNRISKEAIRLGKTEKYEDADKITGTITQNGTVLTYSVPKDMTAYDAVPIEYSLVTNRLGNINVDATTFEETDRYQSADSQYFDLSLPGSVTMDVKYEGYAHAKADSANAVRWSSTLTGDKQGTQYPAYDDPALIDSGTVKSDELNWFKFSFTNTGNTILDSEGGGAFCWHPVLYKKNANGGYDEYSTEVNYNERLYDYMYPGETSDFWLEFGNGLPTGEYKIILYGQIRNEEYTEDWAANYVGGRNFMESSFEFAVASDEQSTIPAQVQTSYYDNIMRNYWLSQYEEFMSSFNTMKGVSQDASSPTTGTIYVQPAPWNETLVLKLIIGEDGDVATAQIPINVDSDSISVELNPYNENYTVNDEGNRVPLLATQAMGDMRGCDPMSPYADEVIINDLKNMKDAGINYLCSTMGFSYQRTATTGGWAANKFMMDVIREMGFDFEGYSSYPYNSDATLTYARGVGGVITSDEENGYGLTGINQANVTLSNYSFKRFGDMYRIDSNGTVLIGAEDTRAWMTIDHDVRVDIVSDSFTTNLQNWLKSAFGTISSLNTAYGSHYSGFINIDPRADGVYDTNMKGYDFTQNSYENNVYSDWSDATKQMDLYRTLVRVADYKEVTENTVVPNAKIMIALEGYVWPSGGINESTTNLHYRQNYYEQYRQAVVPEILAASDSVYGIRTYSSLPYTPTEFYELTKNSVVNGLDVCRLIGNVHSTDFAANYGKWGTTKYVDDYNLASKNLYVTRIDTMDALFPSLKAIYEGGGIPGVMWQDYFCDLFMTSTQYKELKFYTSKINEMLSTEEGKEWSENFETTDVSGYYKDVLALWSYPEAYIKGKISSVTRFNVFTDSVKK